MSWEGKQVLITGASGDLGQAMVRKFLKEGAIVTAQYNRRLEPLQRLVEEMELAKERIVLEQADLTSPQEVRELFERLSARTEGLDLLVNNAGGARPVKFESLSLEEWQQAVNLNLTAPFLCIQAALPLLQKVKGTVINISSVAGLTGGAFGPHYATVKAGLIGLGRNAARELGKYGIRVNTIAPGPVSSKMTNSLAPEVMQSILASTAMGRVIEPEEISEVVMWLSSNDIAITGQTLVVDGGRYFN